MDIYVVQPGDTVYSIADKYGVTAIRLIQDNGIDNPIHLVPGQSIVITYPEKVHIVQEGDTLSSIADFYGVTLIQLLRNNSFLSGREYIYPGEILVISYKTNGKVSTNGYTYAHIAKDTLIKSLPYLTYISVFNYQITEDFAVTSLGNDSEVIKLSIDYGVVPLLMISSISPKGIPNLELIFTIMTNKELLDRLINSYLNILQSTGYYGINLLLSGLNENNQKVYIDFLTTVSDALKSRGYLLIITINPDFKLIDDNLQFVKIDYSSFTPLVDNIIFLKDVWGTYEGPPAPVSSINYIRRLIEYVISLTPPEKITFGNPLIGYDWIIPYTLKNYYAYSLTLNSAITLANDVGAIIQFDEISQTPFFQYSTNYPGGSTNHIIWFIDARSINALLELIKEYNLAGSGIWNIMIYYQPLWTLINSQFEINKLIPDNIM
ncbi:MAG TPA: LysM peptidoglycan-binding domain-containing protein [Mobilitalea sp.]|nr:LysM peptidoglycan-binding domain-containing protein [Mobilitalea sp.]